MFMMANAGFLLFVKSCHYSRTCFFSCRSLIQQNVFKRPFHKTTDQSSYLPTNKSVLWLKCKLGKHPTNVIYCMKNGFFSSNKLPKSQIGRILEVAKSEKWKLSFAIILLFVSSTVTLAVPYCLGKVIDIMYNTPNHEIKQRITQMCQFLVVFFIIGGLANFGRVYFINLSDVLIEGDLLPQAVTCIGNKIVLCARQKIVNRLRTIIFGSILKQEIAFFDVNKTGELVNRLSADTTVVGYSITQNISDGLRSSFSILAGIAMMIYISPELSFVGLVIVPPVAAMAVIYGRYLRYVTKSLQDSLADATQTSEENIMNIRTVRSFAQEGRVHEQYVEKISSVLKLATKESMARGIFYGCSGLSGNLVVLTVLYYGGVMMTESQISVGDLSSFLMYAAYVGISIGGISSFYSELMRGVGASERLWELVDRKPAIPIMGGYKPSNLRGDIIFENVSFSFPSRPDVCVLKNFSLSIPAGSVQAIVGTSGSGKSTLANLLLRFYDVNSGSILIDNNNVHDLNSSWLRNQIGSVSQDPVLFSCSIKHNILFGTSDPFVVNEEQIIQSLKQANAWDFIQQFPDSLDAIVGERGIMLSGGQKQRIAIARAIIKDPKVLLLDEATSALDAESEYLVQEALERVMKNRTVIIIAHRLSTITNADKIAVLNKGQIVELGTYNELMQLPDGLFQKLVERQTGNIVI